MYVLNDDNQLDVGGRLRDMNKHSNIRPSEVGPYVTGQYHAAGVVSGICPGRLSSDHFPILGQSGIIHFSLKDVSSEE
jgi:hypothetical protein